MVLEEALRDVLPRVGPDSRDTGEIASGLRMTEETGCSRTISEDSSFILRKIFS